MEFLSRFICIVAYVDWSLVLFAVCCYAAASSLNSIEEKIIRFNSDSTLLNFHCLQKWKRSHAHICSAIDAIGDCFGLITLLLFITHILIVFIDWFIIPFLNCFCPAFDVWTVLNFCQFVLLSLVDVSVNHLQFKVQHFYYCLNN